jgi:ADP-Ribosyltransferase in polyvalent proteins
LPQPSNPLADGLFPPDPTNPLTGNYTLADAADFWKQNLADTWTAIKDPQTWVDAAHQYGNALLAGSVAPTDSPAFQAWFGKSVLRDADGNPMVLYHGTGSDIAAFRPGGTFLTANPKVAAGYADMRGGLPGGGANILPVYARMENPLVHDHGGFMWDMRTEMALLRAAKAGGHDGVIWHNVDDVGGPQTQYLPLSPTQIKSAIGNRGTYDPRDPRLIYGVGGLALGATAAGGGNSQ